jgi:type I restriction enzyme M protein
MAVWSEVLFDDLTRDRRLDAEYYKPVYLEQERRVKLLASKPLNSLAAVSDGNHLTISNQFSDEGVRYLRGQDLNDFFVSDSNAVYIPEEAYDKLKRSHMFPGDVLLSIVGTIGNVALVTEQYTKLTGSCKIAIIRPHSISPYFLAIYFASKIGQDQIARRVRGAVQQGVILPDLKEFPIPLVSDDQENEIERLVIATQQKRNEAQSLYAQAEALLLHELGLDTLDLSHQTTFTATFAEVMEARRLDAEYFQPKYRRVLEALKALGPLEIVPLRTLLTTITNGHTPRHHNLSVGSVRFLTAEHVYDFRINFDTEKRILQKHHEGELNRTRLQPGDMLVTIKGRVGNTAIVDTVSEPTNINQDVALLRLKPDIPPYYVAGFLNCLAGKLLVEQISTSQINPFLGLGNLGQIHIPIFEKHRMQAWGDQIQQTLRTAYETMLESTQLLEQAKQRVEELILGEEM